MTQKRHFKKAAPDHRAFSLIPISAWKPKAPFESLALSRILSGVAVDRYEYTTTSERSLVIPAGAAWCSIRTIRDDISSAVGEQIPRHKIKYAIRKLKEDGLVRSELMAPETAGRYGHIWYPNIDTTEETVDPVKEYRIHAFGDTTAFRHGAIANASPEHGWTQRQDGDVRALMENIAARGNPEALFRSVGMWRRRKEVRKVSAPVFYPWIVLDVDARDDIPMAHDQTHKILLDLEDSGVDMERVFVSFSGSKGFHIAIATSQIGCPIFRDSDSARECVYDFVSHLTDHEFDNSTMSPLQMLRLSGSRHEDTGLYKTTWHGPRFRKLQLHEIIKEAKSFRPFEYPDPTVGEIEDAMMEEFDRSAKRQAEIAWRRIRDEAENGAKAEWNHPRGGLRHAIENGVGESEDWSQGRSGRDWAAFTLACFCIDHEKQHDSVRTMLGMQKSYTGDIFKDVVETLIVWNERNDPPLNTKIVQRKVGSAKRYMERRSE